jgi:hypothetical protein
MAASSLLVSWTMPIRWLVSWWTKWKWIQAGPSSLTFVDRSTAWWLVATLGGIANIMESFHVTDTTNFKNHKSKVERGSQPDRKPTAMLLPLVNVMWRVRPDWLEQFEDHGYRSARACWPGLIGIAVRALTAGFAWRVLHDYDDVGGKKVKSTS